MKSAAFVRFLDPQRAERSRSDNLKPLWMKNHRFPKVLDGWRVHGAGVEGGRNFASQG
jgi:hypothetical protein